MKTVLRIALLLLLLFGQALIVIATPNEIRQEVLGSDKEEYVTDDSEEAIFTH